MTQDGQKPIEEDLTAYLDDELDEDGVARIEAYLEESPEARRRLEELRKISSFVGGLPRGQAPEDLGETVIARLERETLFDGIDPHASATATPPGVLSFGRLVGAAAVILVAVLAGYLTIDYVQQERRDSLFLASAEKQADDELDELAEQQREDAKTRRGPEETPPPKAPPRLLGESGLADSPPSAKRGPTEEAREDNVPPPSAESLAKKGRRRPVRAKSAPKSKAMGRAALDGTEAHREKSAVSESEEVNLEPPLAVARKPRGKAGAPTRGRHRKAEDGEASVRRSKTDSGRPIAKTGQAVETKETQPSPEKGAAQVAMVPPSPEAAAPKELARMEPKATVASRPAQADEGGLRVADQLAKGITAGELSRQRVAQEPVQLQLTASDAEHQTELLWMLKGFFARHRLTDAQTLPPDRKVDREKQFFAEQRATTRPDAQRVILVRSEPRVLDQMLSELSQVAPEQVRVALVTPTIHAQGWKQSQLAAQMLKVSPRGGKRRPKQRTRDRTATAEASPPNAPLPLASQALRSSGIVAGDRGDQGGRDDAMSARKAWTTPGAMKGPGKPTRESTFAYDEPIGPLFGRPTSTRPRGKAMERQKTRSRGFAKAQAAKDEREGRSLRSLGYVARSTTQVSQGSIATRRTDAAQAQAPMDLVERSEAEAKGPKSLKGAPTQVKQPPTREAPLRRSGLHRRHKPALADVSKDELVTVVITIDQARP